MPYLNPPPAGFNTINDVDPTGNNDPSAQLVFLRPDGSVADSGLFVKWHGATAQFYQRASGSGDIFELDGNGRVLINEV